jgi:hypothetical protein
MPQIMRSAPHGRIQAASFYSAGEIAVLMGVAHSTAIRLIDQGEIRGFWMPTKRRYRRVAHQALIAFVRRNPAFRYMLDKLNGYDPGVDFPEGAEPPPSTTRPFVSAAPRSPERPRLAFRGKIPQAIHYSPKEVAFVLGLARRTVNAKLDAGIIRGIRLPSTGLTSWKWRVPHGALVAFLRRHPRYGFAWARIRGCEPSKKVPSPVGEPSARKEPLVPRRAPGWKERPHQFRRGGFKKGPKLPDGRQPSLTKEDIAAREDANRESSADLRAGR